MSIRPPGALTSILPSVFLDPPLMPAMPSTPIPTGFEGAGGASDAGVATPGKAVQALRFRIVEPVSLSMISLTVRQQLERYEDPGLRMDYLSQAAQLLKEEIAPQLSPARQVLLASTMSAFAEEQVVLSAPQPLLARATAIVRDASMIADAVEREHLHDHLSTLTPRDGYFYRAAVDVALSHAAYANTVQYGRYLVRKGKDDMRGTGRLQLCSAILRLHDAAARLKLLQDDRGVRKVHAAVDYLREQEGLPTNEVFWALEGIQRWIDGSFSGWRALVDRGMMNQLAQQMHIFQRALKDVLRGIYRFSPFLTMELLASLDRHDFRVLRTDYQRLSDEHVSMAATLGLLDDQTPEAVRASVRALHSVRPEDPDMPDSMRHSVQGSGFGVRGL
jgi:hypothetical protein